MILTNDEVIQLKTAHQWPADTDPDFWTKVGGLIDQGIPEHASALKAWWLVRGVPFWYPGIQPIELSMLADLQTHYRGLVSTDQLDWARALAEPVLGHTQDTYESTIFDFGLDTTILTGAWPVKNAHHIMKWEQTTGRPLRSYNHIIEIGAGLGDMPRFCYDLGFTGTYTIVDLPATAKIQQHYLHGQYPKVEWCSLDDLRGLTLDPANTLVIATWSLSEVSYEIRTQFCEILAGADWFVTFQSYIFGLNNVEWFPKLFKYLTHSRDVRYEAMLHHRWQGGSWWLYARGT